MAAYRLAGALAEAFEVVRGPFAAALGNEVRLRLGGGTALALRWAHRRSADLDFFFSYADQERVREGHEALEDGLCQRVEVGQLEVRMGGGAECIVAGVTPVSFFPAAALTPDPVSSDTLAGTRVWLEASPEILAKKLVYRVGAGGEAVRAGRIAPARDVYDLAYASRHHPEVFDRAAAAMPFNVLEDALVHLRATDPQVIAGEGRELVGVADESLELEGRDVVVAAIDRHLRGRPPRLPRRPPPPRER